MKLVSERTVYTLFIFQGELKIMLLLNLRLFLYVPYEPCMNSNETRLVSDSTPFLLSPEGKDFLRVFQGLHIGSLLTQELDVILLIKDRILPDSWVYPVLIRQWECLLRVDSGEDRG